MLVSKIIKCKVFKPTRLKYQILEQEYDNLQEFLQLEREDVDWVAEKIPLHSANRQQSLRYYKKLKQKEYPISIRKDLIKLKETEHKFCKYWVRLPVKNRKGGLWLPIKPHKEFPKDFEIAESKVIKRDINFYVYITIKKEVEIKKSYSSVLAIDIGERVLATVLLNGKPVFMGRKIRGIRRHYAWLRKRLGEKKLLKVIKKIGHKEKRVVDYFLHKISKQIVSLAYQHNSLILLGDLKGIRKSAKGKRFNRIVSNIPYFKLTQYITYKANWKGIKVIKIDEKGTSITCSKCGYEDKSNRKSQGLFKCKKCGYQVNADYNGVKNIEKRFLEYISKDEVSLTVPITSSRS